MIDIILAIIAAIIFLWAFLETIIVPKVKERLSSKKRSTSTEDEK